MNGWLHDTMIRDSEEASSSTPIIRMSCTLPCSESSPSRRTISASLSDVTHTNSQPSPKRTAADKSERPLGFVNLFAQKSQEGPHTETS